MAMRYECLAGLESRSMYMRKNAPGKTCRGHAPVDGLRHDLRGLGMGWMRLDNDRTAGCQSRSRVTARSGIGKGEIAGPKNDNGSYGNIQLAEIRITFFRHCSIDP